MKFLLVLFLTFFATRVVADEESLSFRYTSSGEVEAVIRGVELINCAYKVLKPFRIDIQGNQIQIQSLANVGLCSIPIGRRPYEVVADLGRLQGRSYEVRWSYQDPLFPRHPDNRTLSANLVLSELPVQVDTNSSFALVICSALVFFLAVVRLRRGFRFE